MIPKLALNFIVNKDTTIDFPVLFKQMRDSKIIYVEVILTDMDTLDEVKKFMALFKNMRNTKHIDYTIWIDVGADPNRAHDLYLQANKLDRLVMGVASLVDVDNIPNLLVYMNNMAHPSIHDLMLYTDPQSLKHSQQAIDHIHAPDGMKNGLKRVIDDYAKIYYRGLTEPHSEELSTPDVAESD